MRGARSRYLSDRFLGHRCPSLPVFFFRGCSFYDPTPTPYPALLDAVQVPSPTASSTRRDPLPVNPVPQTFSLIQSICRSPSSLKDFPDPICSSHILKRIPLGRQIFRCCPPLFSLTIRPSPLPPVCAKSSCAVAKSYPAKDNRYRHFSGRLCPSCLRRHRDRCGQYTYPYSYFCCYRRRHLYY